MRNSKMKMGFFLHLNGIGLKGKQSLLRVMDVVSEGPAWQAFAIGLATPRCPEVRLRVTSGQLSPSKGDSLIVHRVNRGFCLRHRYSFFQST